MFAEPVIPTSPASAPFINTPTSGRPRKCHDKASAINPPKAPETVVLTRTVGT